MIAAKGSVFRDAMVLWWGPLGLLALAGVVLTWVFLVGPPPPNSFRFAGGVPGGAYEAFAEAYRAEIEPMGVEMEVVPSLGSVDNLKLLQDVDSGVVAALVQGGVVPSPKMAKGLLALGSVTREPLWVFYRSGSMELDQLRQLSGKRIAVGAEGGGTRPVAMRLTAANGLDPEVSPTDLVSIGGEDAAQALLAGEVDAAFFVASIESPRIRKLLADPTLDLMNFSRAEAYERRFSFLTQVAVPEGVVSLVDNVPSRDELLVGPSTMLVVRSDIHPDLVPLLLEAARRVHGDGDLLDAPDEFPRADHVDLPLDPDAERFLEKGPSWLYRVLPYRVAVQVDRLKILLLPLLTLLIPLIKLAPPVYRWRMRARVFRWYESLWDLDMRLSGSATTDEVAQCRRTLAELERDLTRVRVPLSYMAEYYDLRVHVDLVRQRLDALGS